MIQKKRNFCIIIFLIIFSSCKSNIDKTYNDKKFIDHINKINDEMEKLNYDAKKIGYSADDVQLMAGYISNHSDQLMSENRTYREIMVIAKNEALEKEKIIERSKIKVKSKLNALKKINIEKLIYEDFFLLNNMQTQNLSKKIFNQEFLDDINHGRQNILKQIKAENITKLKNYEWDTLSECIISNKSQVNLNNYIKKDIDKCLNKYMKFWISPEKIVLLEKERDKEEQRIQGLMWNYIESQDNMSRGQIKTARVKPLNSINFDFPYQGSQQAELDLRIHPQYGNDVILRIEKGQFNCGSNSCSLNIRFDENQPISVNASIPSDYSTNLVFIEGYNNLINQIRKSKKMHIEAEFFKEGSRVFEFNVEGLNW